MKKLFTLVLLAAVTSACAASPYVGASAGYLIDGEDAFFATRLGFDVANANTLTHSVEAEIGFASDKALGLTLDVVPLMANYRLTSQVAPDKLGYYCGVGAGASRLRLSGWGLRDNTWAFTVQAFAGIEYPVSPAFSVLLGARYIWIDEASMVGVTAEIGDDVAVEAGVRIRL